MTQTFYLDGEPVPHEVVVVGRMRMALSEPHKKTLPPSCALLVWHNDLSEHLVTISRYLSLGAGVKVILDYFEGSDPVPASISRFPDFNFSPNRSRINWKFYLREDHLDFPFMTEEQRKHYGKLSLLDRLDGVEIIKVNDSMRENSIDRSGNFYYSIEDSWIAFIEAARSGKKIWLDLSMLRENGKDNGKGLISTGPLGTHEGVPQDEIGTDSFLSIYEKIADFLEFGDVWALLHLLGQMCKVIKRGGFHKTGIITHSMIWTHEDFRRYLAIPLEQLPGSQKKGIRLTKDLVGYPEMLQLIANAVNQQSAFLEKAQDDPTLFPNVCEGILFRDRGACLLSYANLGRCRTPEDVTNAYVAATIFACKVHTQWREKNTENSKIYRPLDQDQQVGVGLMALANHLALSQTRYTDFISALRAVVNNEPYSLNGYKKHYPWLLVKALEAGFYQASEVARTYGIERFFTIEPNQRCWTDEENNDLGNYVACRNIDPPYNRRERRDSEVLGSKWYYHGPLVETMEDVSHDERQEMWELLYLLAKRATGGMVHAMSFDLTKPIDMEWLVDFIERSPLPTTYYQMYRKVNQSYLNKGLVFGEDDLDDDSDAATKPLDCNCGDG